MTTSAFETYLAKVEADYRHGIATEHTYRSTLEAEFLTEEGKMGSEVEFLEQRLQILEKSINTPVDFDKDEKGRFYLRFDVSPSVEYAYIREAHLIKKLLSKAKEGQVDKALAGWYKFLADELRKHHEHYQKMQEKYDEWRSLPFPTRIEIPEPPHPPELEVKDIQNDNWIVDERLLDLIKDMRFRLSKWMTSSD